ncbi:MAG: alpha/beta hydrolase [Clostridia bacterium]|nr:alpha/beta hydrolase [Clostridia bacterium]
MRVFTESILGRPLRCYLPDATERSHYRGRRPALVIFPGGGYESTYEGEGEPIALVFAAAGIPAFVLDYTVAPETDDLYTKPLREAFAAIRYVRANAEDFGIDPSRIGACGFSAGGHLCGCTATLWNKPVAADLVGENPRESRPDMVILSYAVLKGFPPSNDITLRNLLGKRFGDEEEHAKFDTVGNVDPESPPAFLWATADDEAVPVCATLDYASALDRVHIPFEVHIWPHGRHGLCLGNQVTEAHGYGEDDPVAPWTEAAIRLLYKI